MPVVHWWRPHAGAYHKPVGSKGQDHVVRINVRMKGDGGRRCQPDSAF